MAPQINPQNEEVTQSSVIVPAIKDESVNVSNMIKSLKPTNSDSSEKQESPVSIEMSKREEDRYQQQLIKFEIWKFRWN